MFTVCDRGFHVVGLVAGARMDAVRSEACTVYGCVRSEACTAARREQLCRGTETWVRIRSNGSVYMHTNTMAWPQEAAVSAA